MSLREFFLSLFLFLRPTFLCCFGTTRLSLFHMRLVLMFHVNDRIGTIYNASMGVNNQERVSQWARQNYPGIWARLEERGAEEDEMGFKHFNGIDRSLRA